MTRRYRSGVNTMFLVMGPALVLVGLGVFAAFPLVAVVFGSDPEILFMLLGLPVFALAGTVMALVGYRRWVEIGPDQVRWQAAWGGPVTVPFGAIHHVVVPMSRSGSGAVRLALRNGAEMRVAALTMSSGTGNFADGLYRRTADALVFAHQDWWYRHG